MNRSKAYTNQDAAIHNGVSKNYRLCFTPKQLKRMAKKDIAAQKREYAKLGMTIHKISAPF